MKAVLWLDDELSLLHSLDSSLRAREIQVTFAPDICCAMEHVKSSKFDFYIVDASVNIGALEAQYPEEHARFFCHDYPLGLQFVEYLLSTDTNPISAKQIGICSAHDRIYLAKCSPEILSAVAFPSKITAFLQEEHFIEQTVLLIESSSDADQDDSFHEEFLDVGSSPAVMHDFRQLVLPCISHLRTAIDNISESLGMNEDANVAFRYVFEDFVDESDRILDRLSDTDAVRFESFDLSDDLLKKIKELLVNYSPAKTTSIMDFSRTMLHQLEKLSSYTDISSAKWLYRQMRISLANIDITQVIRRLTKCLDLSISLQDIDEAPFDTSETLREAVEMSRVSAKSRRIDIDAAISPEIYLNRGRKNTYLRLVLNIIENAIKYSGRMYTGNPWVSINHTISDGNIITEIESWGSEIKGNDKIQIFKRGFSTGGSGLGLAIAYKATKELRGSIWVEVRGERGKKNVRNVFVVSIPIDFSEEPAL